MTTRYEQLLDAVQRKAPKTILEVGTWNGRRALEMLRLAPEGCKYYGFDLFESATRETDREEKNVKPHYRLDYVQAVLDGYDIDLIQGNTRETLPAWIGKMLPIEFAWIDGGHSVETIRSDWEAVSQMVAKDAEVYFDDYYTGPIDTAKFGCNQIVLDLKTPIRVLPKRDAVSGGGWVQIVQVML